MSDPAGAAVLLTYPLPALREKLAGVPVIEAPDPRSLAEPERRRVRVWLTTGEEPVGAAELASLPNLGLVVTLGAGYEGVDDPALRARGIGLATGSGINADAVADMAVGLFLAAARGIVTNDARVREGRWERSERVRTIGSRAVGLVGMGAIGKAIAARLAPFGCPLAWTGPRAKPGIDLPFVPDLVALAHRSDVLIVAAALNPGSRGMIDAEVIAALGPEGLLVNVGRGALVDEDALVAALRAGRLGGAALDVFAQEPTPAERWRDLPNVVLSPHVAGVTRETIEAIYSIAARRAADCVRAAAA